MKLSFKGIDIQYTTLDGKKKRFNSEKLTKNDEEISTIISEDKQGNLAFECKEYIPSQRGIYGDVKYKVFLKTKIKDFKINSLTKGTSIVINAPLEELNVGKIQNSAIHPEYKMNINIKDSENLNMFHFPGKITGKNIMVTV